MKEQQIKFSEILNKNEFTDIDDIIEDFSLSFPAIKIPGWGKDVCVKVFFGDWTQLFDEDYWKTECKRIEVWPETVVFNGYTLDFDIPSADSILKSIEDKIKNDVLVPLTNTFDSVKNKVEGGINSVIDGIKKGKYFLSIILNFSLIRNKISSGVLICSRSINHL